VAYLSGAFTYRPARNLSKTAKRQVFLEVGGQRVTQLPQMNMGMTDHQRGKKEFVEIRRNGILREKHGCDEHN